MAQPIEIPRRLVDKLLRKMTPLVAETIELLKENADEDGLTPKLKHWIALYKVDSWADAYEDFGNFLVAHSAAMTVLESASALIAAGQVIRTQKELEA